MNLSRSSSFARLFHRSASDIPEVPPMPDNLSPSTSEGDMMASDSSDQSHLAEQSAAQRSSLGLRARQHALSIMAKRTFEEARKEQLICKIQDEQTGREMLQGVAFRVSKGDYANYPREVNEMSPWTASLCLLNVGVSFTPQSARK
jgi:hypothetical protein